MFDIRSEFSFPTEESIRIQTTSGFLIRTDFGLMILFLK
jgi:hypothetical protein